MTKECSMCGECCCIIPLSVGTMRKEAVEYYLARGIVWDRIQGFLLVPSRCQHLKDTANLKSDFRDQDLGKTYCDIHDHKPEICKKYHGQRRASGGTRFWVPPGCTMK